MKPINCDNQTQIKLYSKYTSTDNFTCTKTEILCKCLGKISLLKGLGWMIPRILNSRLDRLAHKIDSFSADNNPKRTNPSVLYGMRGQEVWPALWRLCMRSYMSPHF